MASFRTPGPAGVDVTALWSEETLALCDPPLPGPLGVDVAVVPDDDERSIAADAWIELDLREFAGNAASRLRRTMVIRIVDGSDSDEGYGCLEVPRPEVAAALAARLVDDPVAAARVRALGDVPATRLAAWTVEQLARRSIKVLWRARQPITTSEPPTAAPSAPPRRIAPSAPSAPTPESSTFPPDLDAAAIADGLKAAAQDGVPFCEECMKQAQAGSGGTSTAAA